MESIVQFIQEQLNAIRPNAYNVSSERNLKSSLEKHEVVVSQLSGDVYSKSSNLPYQIDITTSDPLEVQGDFFVLARNCNNVPFTKIIQEGEENFKSVTYSIVFNTPVVMDKSVDIGVNHYARLVAFASVNEMNGVNQVKKLEIDGETIDKLNSTYNYVTEPSSSRVSGEELTKSKKKSSSSTIAFTSINNATVFLNKAFKISAGQLPGNTKFTVNFELYNGLKAELPMYVNSYQLVDERGKLPSVNIGLALYDDRGDPTPTPPEPPEERVTDLTNTRWLFNNRLGSITPNLADIREMVVGDNSPYKETYDLIFDYRLTHPERATQLEFYTDDANKFLQFVTPTSNIHLAYNFINDRWDEGQEIIIRGGQDATNPSLINWFYENALLLEQVDPEKPTDLTNTKWLFNETLSNEAPNGQSMTLLPRSDAQFTYGLSFRSNNDSFTRMDFINPSSPLTPSTLQYFKTRLISLPVYQYRPNEGKGWKFNENKTIQITGGTDVTNQDLIDFLWNNAVRIL